MGESIYYCQVEPVKKEGLPVWSPSSFAQIIEKVFGSYPYIFTEVDRRELEVLAKVGKGDSGGNHWESLLELLDKYGVIKIWSWSLLFSCGV